MTVTALLLLRDRGMVVGVAACLAWGGSGVDAFGTRDGKSNYSLADEWRNQT